MARPRSGAALPGPWTAPADEVRASLSEPSLTGMAIVGQIEVDDALYGAGIATEAARTAALVIWRDALADIPAPYAMHGWQRARIMAECERFRPTPALVRRLCIEALMAARSRLAKDQRERETDERLRRAAERETPEAIARRVESSKAIWNEVYGNREAS